MGLASRDGPRTIQMRVLIALISVITQKLEYYFGNDASYSRSTGDLLECDRAL